MFLPGSNITHFIFTDLFTDSPCKISHYTPCACSVQLSVYNIFASLTELRPMGGDKEIKPDPGQWNKWVRKKDNTVFCHSREIEL
jgi:hypothetical protein